MPIHEDNEEDDFDGDQERVDSDGKLRLLGRRENLIVLNRREHAQDAIDNKVLTNSHQRHNCNKSKLSYGLVLVDETLGKAGAQKENAV